MINSVETFRRLHQTNIVFKNTNRCMIFLFDETYSYACMHKS